MEKDLSSVSMVINPMSRIKPQEDDRDLHDHFFTDSNVAAQRLGDEDNNIINNNYHEESTQKDQDDQQVDDQLDHHQILKIDNIRITKRTIWAKIEEIFGKELEEVGGDDHHDDHDYDHHHHHHHHRLRRKKRKYRSLDSIYSGTQPMREMKRMILKRKS